MTRSVLLVWALLATHGCGAAESALRWEATTIEVSPPEGEKTARAEFRFKNEAAHPVVIESAKAGCRCTATTLEKQTCQPGENGRLTAVLTIGKRTGDQVRKIHVAVRGEEETILTMITHIPEATIIDPPLVVWRSGDAPAPKSIKLKLPAGTHEVRVSSSDFKFRTLLETVSEGAEYKVSVRPEATDQQALTVLMIEAISPSGHPEVLRAYLQIKK